MFSDGVIGSTWALGSRPDFTLAKVDFPTLRWECGPGFGDSWDISPKEEGDDKEYFECPAPGTQSVYSACYSEDLGRDKMQVLRFSKAHILRSMVQQFIYCTWGPLLCRASQCTQSAFWNYIECSGSYIMTSIMISKLWTFLRFSLTNSTFTGHPSIDVPLSICSFITKPIPRRTYDMSVCTPLHVLM